jgi:hypothetical protein
MTKRRPAASSRAIRQSKVRPLPPLRPSGPAVSNIQVACENGWAKAANSAGVTA